MVRNKRLSGRRTVEPSLLQGLLVCPSYGYVLYRTSTRTSKRPRPLSKVSLSAGLRLPRRRAQPNDARESLEKELKRLQNACDRLLTAYQKDLLSLDELRQRMSGL